MCIFHGIYCTGFSNGCHCTDHSFKCNSRNENFLNILYSLIDKMATLVQIMTWHQTGDKDITWTNVGMFYWHIYASLSLNKYGSSFPYWSYDMLSQNADQYRFVTSLSPSHSIYIAQCCQACIQQSWNRFDHKCPLKCSKGQSQWLCHCWSAGFFPVLNLLAPGRCGSNLEV